MNYRYRMLQFVIVILWSLLSGCEYALQLNKELLVEDSQTRYLSRTTDEFSGVDVCALRERTVHGSQSTRMSELLGYRVSCDTTATLMSSGVLSYEGLTFIGIDLEKGGFSCNKVLGINNDNTASGYWSYGLDRGRTVTPLLISTKVSEYASLKPKPSTLMVLDEFLGFIESGEEFLKVRLGNQGDPVVTFHRSMASEFFEKCLLQKM